jgi:hypothetical protein
MNLSSRFVLEETALGALLFGALLILAVMSFVFAYHWKRFGVPTPLFRRMRRLYWVVSCILAILSVLLCVVLVAA